MVANVVNQGIHSVQFRGFLVLLLLHLPKARDIVGGLFGSLVIICLSCSFPKMLVPGLIGIFLVRMEFLRLTENMEGEEESALPRLAMSPRRLPQVQSTIQAGLSFQNTLAGRSFSVSV